MGAQQSAQDLKWPLGTKHMVEQHLLTQTQNKKMINFAQYEKSFFDVNPIIPEVDSSYPNETWKIEDESGQTQQTCLTGKIGLTNYRRYSDFRDNEKYKGLVFFLHDLGDYVTRHGALAKKFTELGYDFYAMDQRGHGQSGGADTFMLSLEQVSSDFAVYFGQIIDKFYGKEQGFKTPPPIFIVGHGTGAMIAMNFLMHKIDVKYQLYFSAVAFINPFWQWLDIPAASKSMNNLRLEKQQYENQPDQTKSFNSQYTPEVSISKEFLPPNEVHWVFDLRNRYQKQRFPKTTMMALHVGIKSLTSVNADQLFSTNFKILQSKGVLVLTGERDYDVNNDTAKQIFNIIDNKNQKTLFSYKGLGHGTFRDQEVLDWTVLKMDSIFIGCSTGYKWTKYEHQSQEQEIEVHAPETAKEKEDYKMLMSIYAPENQVEADLFDLMGL